MYLKSPTLAPGSRAWRSQHGQEGGPEHQPLLPEQLLHSSLHKKQTGLQAQLHKRKKKYVNKYSFGKSTFLPDT